MLRSSTAVIGRERELAAVEGFLDADSGPPAALVLEGPAGIGKTAIWVEALSRALAGGTVVRACRCAVADAVWAFSGLGDMLEALPAPLLADLPKVQRQALSAAVLLDSTTVVSPGDRVVAVAVLGVLRALARSGPLVVAVDDVQWLDNASRTVLAYALRRLDDEGVRVLASRRTDDTDVAVAESCLGVPGDRLSIGPVSVGSLQKIVHSRLSLTLSRPTLTRLHQATGGNPMVCLEMGRVLQRRGHQPTPEEPLPVPADVRLLVADRLDCLSDSARDLLVVCSTLAQPTVDAVAAALRDPRRASQTLAEVVASGVMEVDGGRLRFTHPLVASVAYAELTPEDRQALHRRLAAVSADPEERGRHLGLGSTGPDADVADALELAARHASGRGRRQAAAELAEAAIARTPVDRVTDLGRRRVAAGEYLFHLGSPDRARSLVMAAVDDAAPGPGPDRVPGLLLLATIDYWIAGSVAVAEWCEQAMREAGGDRLLVARCHAALADLAPYDAVRLLGHARTAVELMEQGDDAPPDVLASALKNVAYHELRLGQGLSLPLLDRAERAEAHSEPVPVIERVGMYRGMLLRFVGQFAEARDWLLRMRTSAQDEGDESALPNILGHLALLECWAGDFPRALRYAAEGHDLATQTRVGSPSVTAAHALAEAHIGHIDEARRIAGAAVAHDESQGDASDLACDLRSLGFADLSVGDIAAAAEHFLRALSIAADLGVKEPAILRIHADAVEALVGLGRLDEAERLTEELEATRGAEGGWSRAMAGRCRGLLFAAIGDLPAATAAFAAALDDHAALGMPFEEARTRLWMGRVLRRVGRRSEARTALEIAAETFVRLGTPMYADIARVELGRLGGRVAEPFTLTSTETRVADLVGSGRTNQEVAETLFVSVRTVESHLGRIYRKLGVRSRTELARAVLPTRGVAPPD